MPNAVKASAYHTEIAKQISYFRIISESIALLLVTNLAYIFECYSEVKVSLYLTCNHTIYVVLYSPLRRPRHHT